MLRFDDTILNYKSIFWALLQRQWLIMDGIWPLSCAVVFELFCSQHYYLHGFMNNDLTMNLYISMYAYSIVLQTKRDPKAFANGAKSKASGR